MGLQHLAGKMHSFGPSVSVCSALARPVSTVCSFVLICIKHWNTNAMHANTQTFFIHVVLCAHCQTHMQVNTKNYTEAYTICAHTPTHPHSLFFCLVLSCTETYSNGRQDAVVLAVLHSSAKDHGTTVPVLV